jgi:undecaprenyl phosphate-alpha-L-ara4FN deformylase
MRIALRISCSTYRGTLRGIPYLADILRRNRCGGTFFFALGPDRTGRLARNALRTGGITGTHGISANENYGLASLLYGTVFPGPDLGRRGSRIFQAVRDAGFECAIQGWDHASWRNHVADATATWTEIEMRRAHERYADIFGSVAPGHAAAGWQMNPHALRLTQRLGYQWASDCRGTHPFVPVWNGEVVHCLQLPTTLPTIDELIGHDGITPATVHDTLLRLTDQDRRPTHVFSVQAELEGIAFHETLESLLTGWREQGYELVSLGDLASTLDRDRLPRHEMIRGEVAGRSGTLMLQGEEYLSTWKEAA